MFEYALTQNTGQYQLDETCRGDGIQFNGVAQRGQNAEGRHEQRLNQRVRVCVCVNG